MNKDVNPTDSELQKIREAYQNDPYVQTLNADMAVLYQNHLVTYYDVQAQQVQSKLTDEAQALYDKMVILLDQHIETYYPELSRP